MDEKELTLEDLIAEWQDTNKAHHFEGSSGVKNLCRLVRALGYVDDMRLGQFGDASYGDLVNFLEDNSGACNAIVGWIGTTNSPEWKEEILTTFPESEDECEDGEPEENILGFGYEK